MPRSFSRASLCACLLSSIACGACGGQNASTAADAGPGDDRVDGRIVDATPDQAAGDASGFDAGGR